MKKNILGKVVLTIILSLCLSSVVFAAEVIELTLWHASWWSEKAPLIVEEFEKAFPQYKLKIDCLPVTGYVDNAITSILSGNPPDIFDLDAVQISSFAGRNLLTDLTTDIGAKLKKEDFAKAVWAMAHYDGKMYGLPNRSIGNVMYYNKTMFDDAGLAYPKEGWTFDDLLDMAKKITVPGEKYGYAISADSSDPGTCMTTFSIVLWGFGGDFLNEDNTKCTLDSPEAIKAITWLTELYTKHKVVPEGTPLFAITRDGVPLFADNKIAMIPMSDNVMALFEKYPPFRWDIVEMPNGGKNKASGYALVVPINAKHKVAAMDYLLWFAKPEVQSRLTPRVPANIHAYELAEPWNSPMYLKYFEASKNGMYLPTIEKLGELTTIVLNEFQKALIEEKTPEQAAKYMTLQIDLLLK